MANQHALSARVKKLAKDFSVVDGKVQMPFDKMHTWMGELDKVPVAEKKKLVEELIALAIKFERDGKELAGIATAQLYTFAAGVLKYGGPEEKPKASKPASKPAAKSAGAGGGWGAKSKK